MAIVSFWSDGKTESGKTVSIAAIATSLTLEQNYKVLIVNTKYNDITLEDCFWNNTGNKGSKLNFRDINETGIDSGIKGLSKAILSNKMSPEIITNYTKAIFKNKLELLTDTEVLKEEYNKNRRLFNEIVKMANKYYDLVFVDVEGDLNDDVIGGILENSDLIVCTLSQRRRILNEYKMLRKEQKIISNKNVITLIGRCDEDSTYNLKNISRYIGEKETYQIPFNTLFFQSVNEGQVADFFIKFRKTRQVDANSFFISSVKTTSEAIVDKIKRLQEDMYYQGRRDKK